MQNVGDSRMESASWMGCSDRRRQRASPRFRVDRCRGGNEECSSQGPERKASSEKVCPDDAEAETSYSPRSGGMGLWVRATKGGGANDKEDGNEVMERVDEVGDRSRIPNERTKAPAGRMTSVVCSDLGRAQSAQSPGVDQPGCGGVHGLAQLANEEAHRRRQTDAIDKAILPLTSTPGYSSPIQLTHSPSPRSGPDPGQRRRKKPKGDIDPSRLQSGTAARCRCRMSLSLSTETSVATVGKGLGADETEGRHGRDRPRAASSWTPPHIEPALSTSSRGRLASPSYLPIMDGLRVTHWHESEMSSRPTKGVVVVVVEVEWGGLMINGWAGYLRRRVGMRLSARIEGQNSSWARGTMPGVEGRLHSYGREISPRPTDSMVGREARLSRIGKLDEQDGNKARRDISVTGKCLTLMSETKTNNSEKAYWVGVGAEDLSSPSTLARTASLGCGCRLGWKNISGARSSLAETSVQKAEDGAERAEDRAETDACDLVSFKPCDCIARDAELTKRRFELQEVLAFSRRVRGRRTTRSGRGSETASGVPLTRSARIDAKNARHTSSTLPISTPNNPHAGTR
ncbi:hypothetical protein C8F01DRAFT_1087136 [Mycena amicta]|nr:hypothetical protein C8F01DRAFT_1087136 [Mycena amicta]